MAYWKYHLETGDLVRFEYDDDEVGHMIAWGTVKGFIDHHDEEPETADEVDFSKIDVKIDSGNETVTVTVDDILKRKKKEERETDIPSLSERFRFEGGVTQKRRQMKERIDDDGD